MHGLTISAETPPIKRTPNSRPAGSRLQCHVAGEACRQTQLIEVEHRQREHGQQQKWRRKSEQRDQWKLRASSWAEEGLARRRF